jgi:hypothetical protein
MQMTDTKGITRMPKARWHYTRFDRTYRPGEHMKTYSAPALTRETCIVDLTAAGGLGQGDPIVKNTGFGAAPGNVGFQL